MLTRRALIATGAATAAGAVLLPGRPAAATVPLGTRVMLPSGRVYYLTAPSGPDPAPLFVVLGGTGATAQATADQTAWPTLATGARRCVVAVGEQVGIEWAAGGGWPATADDLAYLAELVTDVCGRAAVTGRYVAGFSAGGMLAWRAMAETGLFAAAGVVSGALLVPCPRAADVIHLHGTADTTVPVQGGTGYRGFVFPPAYREPWRIPRASVWSLLPHTGAHVWPGYATAVIYDFCTRDRLAAP